MTMILDVMRTCAVCGHNSKQIMIASTNAFGYSDLDFRPPEMARSTIHQRIQICPNCKYCAANISSPCPPEISEYITHKEYLALFDNPSFPETARKYLCSGWLLSLTENNDQAGWDALSAAWICDDNKQDEQAIYCREKALVQFNMAQKKQISFFEEDFGEELILIDLYRRSGRMEKAAEITMLCLTSSLPENMSDLFKFELELIARGDQTCHNMGEVLER